MKIRNRDIPGVVWVLLLIVGTYSVEYFLPGNYTAEGVLGIVGAALVILKGALSAEERKLVEEFEKELENQPDRMGIPTERLYNINIRSGSVRKLLLG